MSETEPMIALAGASGDLGFRIARAVADRGAKVRALVRPEMSRARLNPLDNARYEGLVLTSVRDHLADLQANPKQRQRTKT